MLDVLLLVDVPLLVDAPLPALEALLVSVETSCWKAALKVDARLEEADEPVVELLPDVSVARTSLSVACVNRVVSAAMELAVLPLFDAVEAVDDVPALDAVLPVVGEAAAVFAAT